MKFEKQQIIRCFLLFYSVVCVVPLSRVALFSLAFGMKAFSGLFAFTQFLFQAQSKEAVAQAAAFLRTISGTVR